MIQGTPSRTALLAARHRAIHQIAEMGDILADPLAIRILGYDGVVTGPPEAIGAARPMRMFVVLRSRFADECIRHARARGVDQIVILGAGLDLTAFRFHWCRQEALFEVDHPDTQAWKRVRLREAGVPLPEILRFVPVNFECEQLGASLICRGFDPLRAAIFIWLGVTPYLTLAAISSTLNYVASLAAGAEIVFDYAEEPGVLPAAARLRQVSRMAQVAASGEPWISLFHPSSMHDLLRNHGFRHIEDRTKSETAALFRHGLSKSENGGGHIVRTCNFEVSA